MEIKIEKTGKIIYLLAVVVFLVIGILHFTDVWIKEAGFFGDEGALIYNIKTRNFWEFFYTLDKAQSCPPFFLIFNKIIYSIYGLNEVALRFLSYFCGVLTLILIPFVGNKVFKITASSLIFIAAITSNWHINYFLQDCKQYSLDVFFSFLCLYLFLTFKEKINTTKRALLSGIFFSLAGFISYPSEFIIFTALMYFIYQFHKQKNYKCIIYMCIPYFIGLALLFLLIYKETMGNGILTANDWYLNPEFGNILNYTMNKFAELLGLNISPIIIAILIFIGVITLFIKEKSLAYILITPIILNIISGLLHLYPYTHTRAVIYTVPILCIICLKPFDLLISTNKKFNIFFQTTLFVFAIVSSTYLFQGRVQPTYFPNMDKSYYFIQSNAKEYIEKLKTKNVKDSDIIFADTTCESIIELYDKENKYINNIIFQNWENPLKFYDNEKLKHLDDIKKGTNIYFYNTPVYPSNEIIDLPAIEQWIEENTQIIYEEKDDFGMFLYVKKIK